MGQNTNSISHSRRLAKGLATLALLKANFDSGIDHLDMLLPFVVDCIASQPTDHFMTDDVRSSLKQRYGLHVPSATMQMVLNRARRRKLVRREGGLYFREKSIASTIPDIQDRFSQIQREHVVVAQSLIEYGRKRKLTISSEEDALAMIFEFVSQFHVQVLLEGTGEDAGAPVLLDQLKGLGSTESRTVAHFLLSECVTKMQLQSIIRRIIEGYVLQNALLLNDITAAKRKFRNLTVYFDTTFLLNALGLAGESARLLARESLDLLRSTNAKLAVFDITISEIKRILYVYERHLGTQAGIESLRPYPVARYLVTQQYSPSDIRQESALLEEHLDSLGLRIVRVPERKPHSTLGEEDLTKRLKRPDDSDMEPRVVHDVDCTAAVLTLRGGHHPHTYDAAIAVFATSTGRLVKTVRDWFREQGEAGLSPVIHVHALSSIAWLKKPIAAPDLKLNELIALCSAAIAPSPRTWELFIKHLRRLCATKAITNDEVVAVIASQFSDRELSEFDNELEPDAQTLTEVVDRVRHKYMSEAEAEIKRIQKEVSERIKVVEVEKVQTEQRRLDLVRRLEGKARSIAKAISWVFFIISIAVFIVAPFLIGNLFTGILSYVITLLGWITAAASQIWGGYLEQWRRIVELVLEKKLRNWFGLKE